MISGRTACPNDLELPQFHELQLSLAQIIGDSKLDPARLRWELARSFQRL